MKYRVNFPTRSIENKFSTFLKKIPHIHIQDKIIEEIDKLGDNPRPYGKKPFRKLNPPVQIYQFTAQYRIRIGDYRVLYDVDDKKKIVWILALRIRGQRTYKK